MKKTLSIVLGMFIFGSAWAYEVPQNYEYAIRIPQTAKSCQQEAAELGARFHAATGIKPNESTCLDVVTITAERREYTLYSLSVSYTARASAELYSANYGLSESYG